MINKIFDRLDDWKHLHSYQMERRVDIFFSLYLPIILEKKFGKPISHIIPEFPVRIGIKPNHARPNKSYKIDFLAFSEKAKCVYLVELKTDHGSIRKEQIQNMIDAKKQKVHGLLEGIITVYNESAKTYSRYAKKHRYLIDKLIEMGWITQDHKAFKAIEKDFDIKIVFVQPKKQTIEDYDVICFENVAEYLKDIKDPFTIRFVKSLSNWTNGFAE
jgi:hypothetical protein